jgi:O-antigen/teichoic acid export membrane protein
MIAPETASAPNSLRSPSLKRHLLSSGGWAFGGQVAAAAFGLAVNALLARLLTPGEVGDYFLLLSLVSVAAVLAQLGLNRTVVRLVAESLASGRPGRARAAVRTVLGLGVIGMFLTGGALGLGPGQWLAIHLFDSPRMAGVMGLAVLWMAVTSAQELLSESIRGFHDIRLATLLGKALTTVISAVLFLVLWGLKHHSDLAQVLTLSVAAGMTGTVIAGWVLKLKLGDLAGNETIRVQEIGSIAWPILITNLTLLALSQANLWVLGGYRPQEEVAVYGAAVRVAMLVGIPILVANAVVPPLIAEMHSQDKKAELEKTLRATATLTGIPALMAVIILAAFGEPILGFLYGDFYREGVMVLVFIALGQLINVWAGSCGFTLIMTGHEMTMMWITVLSGILTIAGALWLVRDFGAPGVAAVGAVMMMFQNTLMLLFARKKSGVWTHGRFSLQPIRQLLPR